MASAHGMSKCGSSRIQGGGRGDGRKQAATKLRHQKTGKKGNGGRRAMGKQVWARELSVAGGALAGDLPATRSWKVIGTSITRLQPHRTISSSPILKPTGLIPESTPCARAFFPMQKNPDLQRAQSEGWRLRRPSCGSPHLV